MRGGDAATGDKRGRLPAAGAARSASFVRETRFALAPHVFACVDDSHVVLLDLKRDEYYALDLSVTRGLATVVPGWPDGGLAARRPGGIDHVRQAVAGDPILVAESLLLHGLLVKPPSAGKRMHPPHVLRAEDDLQTEAVGVTRVGFFDLAQVARAALVAALLLRCYPLERIVRRILSRKRRSTATRPEHVRLARLIGRFERLRPLFFFPARERCLLDSLALLEFLAGHDIHPDWVFGVRTRPFAAHCWVQFGHSVCNDSVERVCRFTPILVA